MNQKIRCACNQCDEWIDSVDKQGRPHKYKHGHQTRGENNPMYGRCGKNSPMLGYIHSSKTKQKISASMSLAWKERRHTRDGRKKRNE